MRVCYRKRGVPQGISLFFSDRILPNPPESSQPPSFSTSRLPDPFRLFPALSRAFRPFPMLPAWSCLPCFSRSPFPAAGCLPSVAVTVSCRRGWLRRIGWGGECPCGGNVFPRCRGSRAKRTDFRTDVWKYAGNGYLCPANGSLAARPQGLKGNAVQVCNSSRCCEFRPGCSGLSSRQSFATDLAVGKASRRKQVRRPAFACVERKPAENGRSEDRTRSRFFLFRMFLKAAPTVR